MLGWYLYVFFLVVLGAMACVAFLLKAHQYFPRQGRVLCPETRKRVALQLDRGHALRTFFTNVAELRVKDCERWPERADCDQECLLQVDAEPARLEHTLSRFYEGKACARCNKSLEHSDWGRGRFAMLNEKDEFLPAARIALKKLPMALEGCRPLCWACHQAEREHAAGSPLLKAG